MLLPHDRAADRAGLVELALVCRQFTPRAALEEAEHPESLLLDIAGCGHLFGGEGELVDAVAAELTARGYHPRLAVADTIGAAWALARFGEQAKWDAALSRSRLVSPDARLRSLPAAALRLPDDVLRKLLRLGLTTIGRILDLPRESLPSRFGPVLLKRVDQLLGGRPEIATPVDPPEPLRAEWRFEDPVEDRAVLLEVLRRLLEQLLAGLGPQRAVQRVECAWEASGAEGTEGTGPCRGSSPLLRSVSQEEEEASRGGERAATSAAAARALRPSSARCAQLILSLTRPTSSLAHLQELAALQMERLAPAGPVARVIMEAHPVPRPAARQRSLFDGDNVRPQEQQAALLDRLCSRLGERTVLQPRLADDWLPERSVVWVEAGNLSSAVSRQRAGGARQMPREERTAEDPAPLRLYARPVAADAVLHRDCLLRLRWEGREELVTACVGPRRIETGWQRRQFIRRDYYRIATASGRRLWAYAQPEGRTSRWFVMGE